MLICNMGLSPEAKVFLQKHAETKRVLKSSSTEYGKYEFEKVPLVDTKYKSGVRHATIYFDKKSGVHYRTKKQCSYTVGDKLYVFECLEKNGIPIRKSLWLRDDISWILKHE